MIVVRQNGSIVGFIQEENETIYTIESHL